MTSIFSRFVLTICCISAISTATADADFIKPYRVVYDANYDFFLPIRGKAIRELHQQEDGHWVLSHSIDSSLLTLKETSLFEWQQQQPKTITYNFKQRSIGKSRNELLEFDWNSQQVHHTTNKPAGSFEISKATLDKLTYQLKIRQDLSNSKDILVYSVADKRKLKQYGFDIIGNAVLETPMGKLNTLQIKRDRGANAKRETTLWLAKDWDYLLVKIHQKEKGKDYEVVMVEGELDGNPIKGL